MANSEAAASGRGVYARCRPILVAMCAALTWIAALPACADEVSPEASSAFLGAQRLVNSAATQVVAERVIIDAAAPDLASLLKRRLGLVSQIDATREAILALSASASETRDQRTRLLEREIDLQGRLEALNRELSSAHGGMAGLLRPRPLAVDEVRDLLAPGEAVLLMVPTVDAVFVFAVSDEGFGWHRAELGEVALRDSVARLRQSLGLGGETRGQALRPGAGAALSGYDTATAHRLYVQMIAPLEAVLDKASTVYAVKAGPLRSLPLGILTTEPVAAQSGFVDLSQARFLVDRFALAELPTLSSFKVLRCRFVPGTSRCDSSAGTGAPAGGAVTFLGVGAPDLTGEPAGTGPDVLPAGTDLPRMARASALRGLDELPGALDELRAVEASLPMGSRRSLLSGRVATQANLLGPMRPILEDADIIIFATHGLTGDEAAVSALNEPGLVLTPPARPLTPADDGYLSASEIARLDLGARLVILSACNTIGGLDASETEGVGALSQAFFAAGAQSVVASHWAISDQATGDIVAELVRAHTDGLPAPQALQQAVRAYREANPGADPYLWGAFSYVGVSPPGAP